MADPRQESDRVARIETARKKAQAKANVFFEVFNTPQGKQILAELKEQFDPSVLATGGDSTIIRAAQRDVVRWIEEVINRGIRHD